MWLVAVCSDVILKKGWNNVIYVTKSLQTKSDVYTHDVRCLTLFPAFFHVDKVMAANLRRNNANATE